VQLDHKDLLDPLEQQVLLEHKDLQDQQVPQVLLDLLELKVLEVSKDLPERKDKPVHQDIKATWL
jgi:hypothetical protein